MSVFNKDQVNHLEQPMFFGEATNVARYESQRYPIFEQLIEKQLSFFWRPQEIDLTRDKIDFETKMDVAERHGFTENLKYQTLLDSVQGRAPGISFLSIASDVSLETWIQTWGFSETIHSRSYTHIMRNVYPNPSIIFDDIILNDAIMKRAEAVSKYYDDCIEAIRDYDYFKSHLNDNSEINQAYENLLRRDMKKKLYLCMHAVNALEAIRFYVSFSVTFSFAEAGKMEGNAKIMKLIARDEQLHLKGTQFILRLMQSGRDDPEMAEIAKLYEQDAVNLFLEVADQEKEWIEHLFKFGPIGTLSKKGLYDYVDYLTVSRMNSAGLPCPVVAPKRHPMPWIKKWLNSEAVQVAAQEVEISSYLISQIDMSVTPDFFKNVKRFAEKRPSN